jgi:predicted DNA-binding transcriptional regulator AlpA
MGTTFTSHNANQDFASTAPKQQHAKEGVASAAKTLWKVRDAAAFLKISPGTLFHWVSQKRIPCIRFGSRCLRFDPEQTREWAAQHVQPESSDATRANNHTPYQLNEKRNEERESERQEKD